MKIPTNYYKTCIKIAIYTCIDRGSGTGTGTEKR